MYFSGVREKNVVKFCFCLLGSLHVRKAELKNTLGWHANPYSVRHFNCTVPGTRIRTQRLHLYKNATVEPFYNRTRMSIKLGQTRWTMFDDFQHAAPMPNYNIEMILYVINRVPTQKSNLLCSACLTRISSHTGPKDSEKAQWVSKNSTTRKRRSLKVKISDVACAHPKREILHHTFSRTCLKNLQVAGSLVSC